MMSNAPEPHSGVVTLKWGLRSDIGRARRINQDAAMANGHLFAVADGMGGHRGGEVASDIVAGHFRIQEWVPSVAELETTVIEANRLIRARAELDPSLAGMGTTVAALAVVVDDGVAQLAAANVGDSRIYRLEDSGLVQLTQDHSLVAELMAAGQLSEAEAARHPQRNVVTRALGVDDRVDVDLWSFPLSEGDRYLVCSDGLTNEVNDGLITYVLQSAAEPDDAADQLVQHLSRIHISEPTRLQ